MSDTRTDSSNPFLDVQDAKEPSRVVAFMRKAGEEIKKFVTKNWYGVAVVALTVLSFAAFLALATFLPPVAGFAGLLVGLIGVSATGMSAVSIAAIAGGLIAAATFALTALLGGFSVLQRTVDHQIDKANSPAGQVAGLQVELDNAFEYIASGLSGANGGIVVTHEDAERAVESFTETREKQRMIDKEIGKQKQIVHESQQRLDVLTGLSMFSSPTSTVVDDSGKPLVQLQN